MSQAWHLRNESLEVCKRRSGWQRGEGLRGGNPEAEGQGSSDQSSCVGKRAEEGEQTSRSAVNSDPIIRHGVRQR